MKQTIIKYVAIKAGKDKFVRITSIQNVFGISDILKEFGKPVAFKYSSNYPFYTKIKKSKIKINYVINLASNAINKEYLIDYMMANNKNINVIILYTIDEKQQIIPIVEGGVYYSSEFSGYINLLKASGKRLLKIIKQEEVDDKINKKTIVEVEEKTIKI